MFGQNRIATPYRGAVARLIKRMVVLALLTGTAVEGSWSSFRGLEPDTRQRSLLGSYIRRVVFATVWKLIIGSGCNQVALQGDKVFVSYVEDKVDTLVSLDAATSDEYWRYDQVSSGVSISEKPTRQCH